MLEHEHHYYWWKFFPKKEMNQIYLAVAFRAFALSLISIFIPMYLYSELGYSLEVTLGFFIFYSVIFAISTPMAAKFSSKYGLKHSILLSVPLFILHLITLYNVKNYAIPLALVAAFLGAGQAFFWMGMHLEFKRISHKKHRGEEVGKRQAFTVAGTLLGPLIGGYLISTVGFSAVFILSCLLLGLSAIFLFASKEKHVPYNFSVRSLINKRYWRDSSYYSYKGVLVMINGVIWPLFIFIALEDYLSLGIIGTFVGIGSALLMYITGKFSDKKGKQDIIFWTVPFESLTWFIRSLFYTFGGFLAISLLNSATAGILTAPLSAKEYDHAKNNNVEYFIVREVFICVGRVLILSIVLITGSFVASFWLTGAASFIALIF